MVRHLCHPDESDPHWLFSGDSNKPQQDDEVDIYVKIKIGTAQRLRFDVLNFWFSQHQLANLKLFAFQFLHIPASSAPSERVFSRANLVVSKLSARLTDENAKILTFISVNREEGMEQGLDW